MTVQRWIIAFKEAGHPTLDDAVATWHRIWSEEDMEQFIGLIVEGNTRPMPWKDDASEIAASYVVGRLVDVRALNRPDHVLPNSELR